MKCTNCAADVTNGLALCQRCQQTLTVALVNVAAYYADVTRIRPGQNVRRGKAVADPVFSEMTAAPSPIDRATDETVNAVQTWVRALEGDRDVTFTPPRPTAETTPGFNVKAACAWLEHHANSIFTLEWAGELLRDLLAIEKRLRKIIDNADTGWYAGTCGNELAPERPHDGFTCACACHHGEACDIEGGCGEGGTIDAVTCPRGLYAVPGVNWIRCPECGRTWEVNDRRDAMMRQARDHVAPVRAIAKVVVGLIDGESSEERLTRRIEQWVHREQLRSMGVRVYDGRERRTYRLGDVFDLVQRDRRKMTGEKVAT